MVAILVAVSNDSGLLLSSWRDELQSSRVLRKCECAIYVPRNQLPFGLRFRKIGMTAVFDGHSRRGLDSAKRRRNQSLTSGRPPDAARGVTGEPTTNTLLLPSSPLLPPKSTILMLCLADVRSFGMAYLHAPRLNACIAWRCWCDDLRPGSARTTRCKANIQLYPPFELSPL